MFSDSFLKLIFPSFARRLAVAETFDKYFLVGKWESTLAKKIINMNVSSTLFSENLKT
jgi:hypothetical protein